MESLGAMDRCLLCGPECPALITFSHVNTCRLQEVVELNFLFKSLCRNPPTDSLLNGVPYSHCVRLSTSRKYQEDPPCL